MGHSTRSAGAALVGAAIAIGAAAVVCAGPASAVDYPPTAAPAQPVAVLPLTVSRPAKPVSAPVKPVVAVKPTVSTRGLAYTGSDNIGVGLILGTSLVVVGAGAVVAGRRRTAGTAQA